MGIFSDCTFYVTGNKKLYYPGEKAQGEVSFIAKEASQVKGIYIDLRGAALTNWGVGKTEVTGKESYINKYQVLFGGALGSSTKYTLPAGKHKYKFCLTLPSSGLPSSFEGYYGKIAYWLKLEIARPLLSFNARWYRSISVLANIPVNTPTYQRTVTGKNDKTVSKALGLGNAGELTLSATLDRSAYCPGERMLIDMVANNQSTRDLGVVKATLYQVVDFSASDQSDRTRTAIRSLESDKLKSGQTMRWTKQPFTIDAIPPTTAQNTCHIIDVNYEVKVTVNVPAGFDLEVVVPVIIGTKPFYPSNSKSSENVVVPTPCAKGLRSFSGSTSTFVNIRYTSLTAYVQNYTIPKPQKAVATESKPSPSLPRKPSLVRAGGASARTSGTQGQADRGTMDSDGLSPTLKDQTLVKYVPIEPSAPLLPEMSQPFPLEAPPSYEEATKHGTSSSKSSTIIRKGNGAILLLRFPKEHAKSVRQLLLNNTQNLHDKNGKILSFAVNPLVSAEFASWPHLQSCVLIYFWSDNEAEQWVTSFSFENEELAKDWSALVAPNYTGNFPLPNEANKACNVRIARRPLINTQSKDEMEAFAKQVKDVLRKIDSLPGRQRIITSIKPNFLFGDWSTVLNTSMTTKNDSEHKENEQRSYVEEQATEETSDASDATVSCSCQGACMCSQSRSLSEGDDISGEKAQEVTADDWKYSVSAGCFSDLETLMRNSNQFNEDPLFNDFKDKSKEQKIEVLVDLYFPGQCFDF